MSPCVCGDNNNVDDNVIYCFGNETINLKQIFETLSTQLAADKKHFKQFFLNNTAITELEENVFYDIVFDQMNIMGAHSLTKIHTNAFNETNSFTATFFSKESPLVNSPPDYDLFAALSKMKKLESISIWDSKVEEIPSYAFTRVNGYQIQLNTVEFNRSLRKVMNNAFYNLDALTFVDFSFGSIDTIPANAFRFRTPSNETLNIELDCYLINGSHFEENIFVNVKRPVIITNFKSLAPCQISFLDERIFGSLLNTNVNNKVITRNTWYNTLLLDCSDCRSYWIRKIPNYFDRIIGLNCTDGKQFQDSTNFANCNEE